MTYDELIQTTKEKADTLHALLVGTEHVELLDKVTRLKGLLDAPEMGLVTWNSAVCALLTAVEQDKEVLPGPLEAARAALNELAPDGRVS